MKQLIVLVAMLLGGAVGMLVHPFYGILPYYILAVLRPQAIWSYALPEGVRWSLMAAAIAIFGALIHAPRLLARARWSPVATLLVIFAGLVVVSCLAARDAVLASEHGTEYFKIFIMAILATAVIHRVAHVRWLMLMCFACISYLAWEHNWRYLFQGRLDILSTGHGGQDNNGAAVMLAMGLPLAYAWWRDRRNWLAAAGAAFVALLISHAIMLTYSRSGMLAAIAAAGWIACHHRPRRHLLWLAPLAVMAVLYMAGPEVRQEFRSIREYQQDTSSQRRLDSWQRGWETAWDHPFTGVGPRNSNQMSLAYGAYTNGRSVHNTYLHIAADSGIPAMGVYLAMGITALVVLWRFRARLRPAKQPPPSADDASDGKPLHDDSDRLWAMALAIEGSLIAFAVGAVFLPLELFELPWLMLVIAGALPTVAAAERRKAAARSIHAFDADPAGGGDPSPARGPALAGPLP